MNDYPVWGISKWRDFEECPMKYYAKYITKEWVETPNDAMVRGSKMHKALEEAVKYELKLTGDLTRFQGFIDGVLAMRGVGAAVVPEMKVGMAIDFRRCDYFDGDRLRVRCAYDLYVNKDQNTNVVDYKSGKAKAHHREDAEFYGAVAATGLGGITTTVQYLYFDSPAESFQLKITDPAATLSNFWQKFEYADKQVASGNIPVCPGRQCTWCGAVKCPRNTNPKVQHG